MIEIIQAELYLIADNPMNQADYWACWLQITQDTETWMLPVTAPRELTRAELQAYFEVQEANLWQIAQEKQYMPDLYEHIPLRRALKAFALVVLDEVNVLRQAAGLAARTPDQIIVAIKNKLGET